MKSTTKSSWMGMIPSGKGNAGYTITMPFRDIIYGSVAQPSVTFNELVYHYSNVYRTNSGQGEPIIYPTADTYFVFSRTPGDCKAYIVGPRTRPRAGEYVTDDTNFFVVSLSYIGSYAFLPIAQNEITDKSFTLEEVFPAWGRDLTYKICEAGDIGRKIAIFENFLGNHFDNLTQTHHNFIHVIKQLSNLDTFDNYLKAIKNIGYTERHIRRIFLKYTGVQPYKFTRILRCQTAMKALMVNPGVPMTNLAFELNYYDQTHFTKEFKAFFDFTPTQFVKEFLI